MILPLGLSDLSEYLFSCHWRLLGSVFFVAASVVERTVWHVILTPNSKDTAGGMRHVWNRRENEWISLSGASSVPLNVWSLTAWLVVQWLGSETMLGIVEGGGLHDSAHHIFITWPLEQFKEGIVDIFGDSLRVRDWSSLVWGGEEASTWLNHLVVVLLLSFVMEDSTTVDDSNWGKLGIFANDLLIIIRGSVRCSGKDALWGSARFSHLALAWPDYVWHYYWTFILLTNGTIEDVLSASVGDALLLNHAWGNLLEWIDWGQFLGWAFEHAGLVDHEGVP